MLGCCTENKMDSNCWLAVGIISYLSNISIPNHCILHKTCHIQQVRFAQTCPTLCRGVPRMVLPGIISQRFPKMSQTGCFQHLLQHVTDISYSKYLKLEPRLTFPAVNFVFTSINRELQLSQSPNRQFWSLWCPFKTDGGREKGIQLLWTESASLISISKCLTVIRV